MPDRSLTWSNEGDSGWLANLFGFIGFQEFPTCFI